MATGDQDDLFARLKAVLPGGWFGAPGEAPDTDAAMQAPANAFQFLYALIAFIRSQARVATATGGWLDLAAADFFENFRRLNGEKDAPWSRRIRLELFRDRNTRHAIDRAVYDLTAAHPRIYEAWSPVDCLGYGAAPAGYGIAGRYGSKIAPFEVIIAVPQPQNYGIPNRPGYGDQFLGYGASAWGYADDGDIQGAGATQTDILTALNRVRTASITYYVQFTQVGDPNP